jgi:alkylresorcinol/alkylpyrone synthase
MYLRSVATATPPARYTKAECLEAFERSDWFGRLDPRSHFLARTVLQRDNGIEARRLALDSLAEVFAIDPDTLSGRFLAHAPALATDAARRALARAGLEPASIDGIVVSTCTGYLCPGLSGHVIERLGLRTDVQAYDLVGQGCAAAVPNLQIGRALIASGACEHVLSICVEVSSAAMYLDDDPGVLISACLFGDGAGAAVLGRDPAARDAGSGGRGDGVRGAAGRRIAWRDAASFIEPKERDALMFEQRGGMLRNILTRRVPVLAAERAHGLLEAVLGRHGLVADDVAAWILHAGGRDVLQAVARRFARDPDDFRYSSGVLREYGNLSSAFVYFVLDAALADGAPGGWWWLSAFGAGFSAHGALLEVD